MARENLPGIILTEGWLMVPFTYGCNQCPAKAECGSFMHLQETPKAIRGKLAGSEECLIVKDERWSSRVQVLEPKRI